MGLPNKLAKFLWDSGKRNTREFTYTGAEPPDKANMNDLEQFFWFNSGPVVHKWLHYFDIYDRYFSAFRGTPVRFLEIGVSKGGSLDMWRNYFGPDAVLFGIDIDPTCAKFDGKSAQVRIGSQDDPVFLRKVIEEMGGVDLILDDGSHDSIHIRKTLEVLFPFLTYGGCYMVEDLHAAYWPKFSGGYRRPASFISVVKEMIDDIHHWYHCRGHSVAATGAEIKAIHVHDSIIVLEKGQNERPAHHRTGRDALE
jgi:hypothetical protein